MATAFMLVKVKCIKATTQPLQEHLLHPAAQRTCVLTRQHPEQSVIQTEAGLPLSPVQPSVDPITVYSFQPTQCHRLPTLQVIILAQAQPVAVSKAVKHPLPRSATRFVSQHAMPISSLMRLASLLVVEDCFSSLVAAQMAVAAASNSSCPTHLAAEALRAEQEKHCQQHLG